MQAVAVSQACRCDVSSRWLSDGCTCVAAAAVGRRATSQSPHQCSSIPKPTLSWRLAGRGLVLAPLAERGGDSSAAAATAGRPPGSGAWPPIRIAAPDSVSGCCVRRVGLEAGRGTAGTGLQQWVSASSRDGAGEIST